MISRASQPANPYLGLTYIVDNARMEVPPAWFLARLHDYDAELVVLPSRARPFAYVLARRAQRLAGLTDKAMDQTITQPDTRMCFKYGLVPVCLLFKHGPCWNADTVLETLKARDTWRHGGGERLAQQLDDEEAQIVQRRRDDKRVELQAQSRDAWRSYQHRTGQRIVSAGPSRPGAATKSSSSSTAPGLLAP